MSCFTIKEASVVKCWISISLKHNETKIIIFKEKLNSSLFFPKIVYCLCSKQLEHIGIKSFDDFDRGKAIQKVFDRTTIPSCFIHNLFHKKDHSDLGEELFSLQDLGYLSLIGTDQYDLTYPIWIETVVEWFKEVPMRNLHLATEITLNGLGDGIGSPGACMERHIIEKFPSYLEGIIEFYGILDLENIDIDQITSKLFTFSQDKGLDAIFFIENDDKIQINSVQVKCGKSFITLGNMKNPDSDNESFASIFHKAHKQLAHFIKNVENQDWGRFVIGPLYIITSRSLGQQVTKEFLKKEHNFIIGRKNNVFESTDDFFKNTKMSFELICGSEFAKLFGPDILKAANVSIDENTEAK
eukprot:NODE_4_length_55019_cov_0.425091.p15 type:complete len:356 gc:universal NODE_4_length_55019_cov_0.425091:28674-29741(+)